MRGAKRVLWSLLVLAGCGQSPSSHSPPEPNPPPRPRSEFPLSIAYDAACTKLGITNEQKEQIETAIHAGLSCQRNLGSPTSLSHYGRLRTLLTNPKKPLNFSCVSGIEGGTAGRGETNPNAKVYPAIWMPPGGLDNPAVLHHELMHNLGYEHGTGVDYPYVCDMCCFPARELAADDTLREKVCKACAQPPENVTGSTYYVPMLEALDLSERPMTGFAYATSHLAHGMEPTPSFLYYLAYSALKIYKTACLGVGYYEALIENGEDLDRVPDLSAPLQKLHRNAMKYCPSRLLKPAQEVGRSYYFHLKKDPPSSSLYLDLALPLLNDSVRAKDAEDHERALLQKRFAQNLILSRIDSVAKAGKKLQATVKKSFLGGFRYSKEITRIQTEVDSLLKLRSDYGMDAATQAELMQILTWY